MVAVHSEFYTECMDELGKGSTSSVMAKGDAYDTGKNSADTTPMNNGHIAANSGTK